MRTRTMLAAICLLLTAVAYAQDNNGRGQRQRFNPAEMYTRMADRLARQMKLDNEKAASFKVLYLDYQTARQNAAAPRGESEVNERIDFDKLTDEQARELIQKRFQTQEAQLVVDREYYPKFLEILTPAQTARIYVQRSGNRPGIREQQERGSRRGGRPGGFGGNSGNEDF